MYPVIAPFDAVIVGDAGVGPAAHARLGHHVSGVGIERFRVRAGTECALLTRTFLSSRPLEAKCTTDQHSGRPAQLGLVSRLDRSTEPHVWPPRSLASGQSILTPWSPAAPFCDRRELDLVRRRPGCRRHPVLPPPSRRSASHRSAGCVVMAAELRSDRSRRPTPSDAPRSASIRSRTGVPRPRNQHAQTWEVLMPNRLTADR